MKLPLVATVVWFFPSVLALLDPSSPEWLPIASQGIAGIVLGWFMWDNSKRMRAMEDSLDENTKATMLLSVQLSPDNKALGETANRAIRKIDSKRPRA